MVLQNLTKREKEKNSTSAHLRIIIKKDMNIHSFLFPRMKKVDYKGLSYTHPKNVMQRLLVLYNNKKSLRILNPTITALVQPLYCRAKLSSRATQKGGVHTISHDISKSKQPFVVLYISRMLKKSSITLDQQINRASRTNINLKVNSNNSAQKGGAARVANSN